MKRNFECFQNQIAVLETSIRSTTLAVCNILSLSSLSCCNFNIFQFDNGSNHGCVPDRALVEACVVKYQKDTREVTL